MDVAAIEWDRRNVLPVCNLCHQRHHSGAARIALSVIVEESPTALLFAAELGPEAVAHIHRNYQPTGE